MTLGACLSATATSPAIIIPSEPAVILSHQQLRQQVLAFQTRLAAIGVSYQTAVAIALPNSLEFAIAFLAISLQRAICAPLNPAYKEDEFQFYLQDLNAPLILLPKGAIAGNGEAVRAARACQTGVAEIYWDGSELILDANVGDLEKRQHMHVEALAEEHDVALILHTSGTTGRPKAVSFHVATISICHTNCFLGAFDPSEPLPNNGKYTVNIQLDSVRSNTSCHASFPRPRSSICVPHTADERRLYHRPSTVLRLGILAELCAS